MSITRVEPFNKIVKMTKGEKAKTKESGKMYEYYNKYLDSVLQ